MKIIPAQIEHLSIIRDIAINTWYTTYSNILSRQQITYMLEQMYNIDSLLNQKNKLNHHFILIEENIEYQGFVSFEFNYNNQEKTKIHKLYVLPTNQGKGFGKFLVDEVSKLAKYQNNRYLTLNVNRCNNAVKFYQHIGFNIVKEENINIGQGYLMEDYVLEKNI